MRTLLEFIPQNVSTAFLAGVMAILVWVGATSLELERVIFPLAGQSQGIPIQLKNVPPNLIVLEGENQFVRADLSVLSDDMNRLEVSDFVAEVDLSNLGPGEHQLPVTIRAQPYAPPSRLLGPVPDRIIVSVDEIMTKTVPVEVQLPDRGSLPQTYQVLTTTVSPPEIEIVGPRSLVEPIESMTADARIEGARETVVRTVRPQFTGGVTLTNGDSRRLTTSAQEVAVEINIGLRPGYRDLIVRVDVQGEPADGYWVSSYTPDPPLMTVVGQAEVISALDGIVATEPVNVDGLGEGSFSRGTRLQLPEGVTPLNEGVVQVRIRIEPLTSSKRVSLRPVVTGLAPGMAVDIDAINPPEVTILLKGPITDLENLDLEDVVVTLDVTNEGLGSHIITPQVQAPGTLVAESVNPELVEVTITEEAINRQVEIPVRVVGQRATQVVVVEPPMTTVVLNGAVSLLGNVEPPTATATIDVGMLTNGEYRMNPIVEVSDGVSATTISPVRVTVLTGDAVLNITEQVQVLNLDEGLRVTLGQPTITVRVAPRDGVTRSPGIDDIDVSVNLTGRGVGTLRIKPTVRVSEDFVLVGIVPSEVDITILAEP